ncbi:hypothetical protein OIU76_011447 [Salix suchowensis]|nr:hypothetical protein OIU76_011447 [Salix suchowensis]
MSSENDSHAPLLRPRQDSPTSLTASPTTLAVLLGRATGRRGPSILVRETAARELDERRSDWGYSKPVVALDVLWNAAFVVVSLTMLVVTLKERPNTPIRIWICGYSLQCLVHVILVWLEYRRRNTRRGRDEESQQQSVEGENVAESEDDDGDERDGASPPRSSAAKKCESVNTMVSFLWWIVGFLLGSLWWQCPLCKNAPRFVLAGCGFFSHLMCSLRSFVLFLACLIGIALCCCLPCIIAILYAVAGQEGASEADLSMLPKYKYQAMGDEEKSRVQAGKMVPVESSSGYLATERILLPEDAVSYLS